jgi:hypothetical protein
MNVEQMNLIATQFAIKIFNPFYFFLEFHLTNYVKKVFFLCVHIKIHVSIWDEFKKT